MIKSKSRVEMNSQATKRIKIRNGTCMQDMHLERPDAKMFLVLFSVTAWILWK